MQPYALTIDKFLDHAAKWSGAREVITAEAGRVQQRITYAALRERSNRMSGALLALGLRLGDRVGTLAWNTQHHIEMYYATMGAGMVCHTLNPRYTTEHLASIIDQAQDRVLAIASNLQNLLRDLLPLCPSIEHVIVMDGSVDASSTAAHALCWAHDALLDERGCATRWGDFDENTAAGLCYTSGTTGAPKGVLYTHRSNYLHTLHAQQPDAIAIRRADSLLAAVPMFHANGWGLPFAAPAAGAKLVLPGRNTDGASLAALMREEKISVAVGVHTLWLGVVDHLDAAGGELPDLRRILIGGSKCPEALIQRLEKRLGAEVQTSWGMTELSPLGTIAPPTSEPARRRASGRPPLGVDLKLTDAHGIALAEQRDTVGHLKVKGASAIERYFQATQHALDDDGYFDTGDLASIDADGNVTISGRSKDLIKSGGEWINPSEIEDIVGHHPDVALVAVIGRPDEKWGERPVLVIEPRDGHDIDPAAIRAYLKGKIADWWLPDQVARIDAMPLAATGKIDKNRLRAIYAPAAET